MNSASTRALSLTGVIYLKSALLLRKNTLYINNEIKSWFKNFS
jgi:hypothetical protein